MARAHGINTFNVKEMDAAFPAQNAVNRSLLSAKNKLEEAQTYVSAAKEYVEGLKCVTESLREYLALAEVDLLTAEEGITESRRRVSALIQEEERSGSKGGGARKKLIYIPFFQEKCYSDNAASDDGDRKNSNKIGSRNSLSESLNGETPERALDNIGQYGNEPEISQEPCKAGNFGTAATVAGAEAPDCAGPNRCDSRPVLYLQGEVLGCASKHSGGSSDYSDKSDTEEAEGDGHADFSQEQIVSSSQKSDQNAGDFPIFYTNICENNYKKDNTRHSQILDSKLFNSAKVHSKWLARGNNHTILVHDSSDEESSDASDSRSKGNFNKRFDNYELVSGESDLYAYPEDNKILQDVLNGNVPRDTRGPRGLTKSERGNIRVTSHDIINITSSSDDSTECVDSIEEDHHYAVFTVDGSAKKRTLEFSTDHDQETSLGDKDYGDKSISRAGKVKSAKTCSLHKSKTGKGNVTNVSDDNSYTTVSETTTSDPSVHDNVSDGAVTNYSSGSSSTTSSCNDGTDTKVSDVSEASSRMDDSSASSSVEEFSSSTDKSESTSHLFETSSSTSEATRSLLRDFSGISLNSKSMPSHELSYASFKEGVSSASLDNSGLREHQESILDRFDRLNIDEPDGAKGERDPEDDESVRERLISSPYPQKCLEADAEKNVSSNDSLVEAVVGSPKPTPDSHDILNSHEIGCAPPRLSPLFGHANLFSDPIFLLYLQKSAVKDAVANVSSNDLLMKANANILNLTPESDKGLNLHKMELVSSTSFPGIGIDSQSSVRTLSSQPQNPAGGDIEINVSSNGPLNADIHNLASGSRNSLSSQEMGGLVSSSSSPGTNLISQSPVLNVLKHSEKHTDFSSANANGEILKITPDSSHDTGGSLNLSPGTDLVSRSPVAEEELGSRNVIFTDAVSLGNVDLDTVPLNPEIENLINSRLAHVNSKLLRRSLRPGSPVPGSGLKISLG